MTPSQKQLVSERAMELLREIVNLSLPRDLAGHPAVVEARTLTGCGQAMGVADTDDGQGVQCCECDQEAVGYDDDSPYCAAHYRNRASLAAPGSDVAEEWKAMAGPTDEDKAQARDGEQTMREIIEANS